MKTIHKLALAVMGIGVLIGLGTHIDATYRNKAQKIAPKKPVVSAPVSKPVVSKPVVSTPVASASNKKSRRLKHEKKMAVTSKTAVTPEKRAVKAKPMPTLNSTSKGGIALMKKDDKSNEMFFMFKQMDQGKEMNSANVFNVAMPMAKGDMPQDVEAWGQSGKFNLFVKKVNSWQKPDHNKNNSYVWISESELTNAVDTAMKKHDFSNVVVQARTGKKMVELDKNLLSAIANHYKTKGTKSEGMPKSKKVKTAKAKKVVA
jgi:hypothetical protein